MASKRKKHTKKTRAHSRVRVAKKKSLEKKVYHVFGRKKKAVAIPFAQKITTKPTAKPILLKTLPKWNIRVARFNPTMDFTLRTHEYFVSPKPGESVLGVLTRIKHTQDGSLTFRASCGYGGCGACGVRVNGKPVLGCVTQVTDHLDAHGGLRIDPLSESTLIKDLVVDEKPFFDQLKEVKPWLVPRPQDAKRAHKMGPNDVAGLKNSQQCILCGLCNANARAETKPELGPAAFVKGYRYLQDSRDANMARVSQLSTHLPVYYSLDSANLCPRDIAPGDKIREIREKADKSKAPSSTKKGRP